MALVAVQVVGERELRRGLKDAGQSVTKLTRVHRVVVKQAKADLQAAAPVLTGRLRRSAKPKATSKAAEVRFATPYVVKQEYRPHGPDSRRADGWYFGPEFRRSKDTWTETYWREVGTMLDEAFG